jgi:hypothetical protein
MPKVGVNSENNFARIAVTPIFLRKVATKPPRSNLSTRIPPPIDCSVQDGSLGCFQRFEPLHLVGGIRPGLREFFRLFVGKPRF